MQYSREVTEELNKLSIAVFGTKSKWKKMIDLGVMEPVLEDTKRLVMKDGKEETQTIKTQKVDDNGIAISAMHHYTPETVKEFMLTVLYRRQQAEQAIKKLQEEQKAKEDLKNAVAEAASGTAI
jgi:hypothetical protein